MRLRLNFAAHPLCASLLLSGAYLAAGVLYVVWSGRVAMALAATVEDVAWLEQAKGVGFMVLSSLVLFGLLMTVFRSQSRIMAVQARDFDALLAAERRAMAGVLSVSMAHDLNNRLQVIRGALSLLNKSRLSLDAESTNLLQQVDKAVDQLLHTTEGFRRGGQRFVSAQPVHTELTQFVADSLALVERHERVRFCSVRLAAKAEPVLQIFPELVQDALINMVLNAAEALSGSGRIEIRVGTSGGCAHIEVHDNGPGVAPEARERILAPFYTTKPEGTGLGMLSITACAKAHEGSVELLDSDMGGLCVRLRLCAARA